MNITFFSRPATPGQHSLERVLNTLLQALGSRVSARVWRARGGTWLLTDVAAAAAAQGSVNHIAGHVHYLALTLRPERTVLTVHDIGHLQSVSGVRRATYRALWYTIPLRRVAAIVAVSEFTKKELVREFGVAPAKITTIHDGLPAGFEPAPFEFNAERPTLLIVGTAPHKNAVRLVEAADGLGCRFLFIGRVQGALREALARARAEFEEKVDVADADLIECYRRADIVCFASMYEGFGLPIIEAQAVGRPVITSLRCSMPEVAGDGAVFVDPQSTRAIREAIARVRGSAALRDDLIGKGFANVRRFDRSTCADAHMDIYRRVAS